MSASSQSRISGVAQGHLMNAVTYALLAVLAVEAGDRGQAECHLRAAQQHSRATARRQRQVVEIAGLVVRGDADRARGLSFEHGVEFPEDSELLASMLNPSVE
jgi:hypothetical protein